MEIFKTTAVYKDNQYKHFGISKVSASLYGDKASEIIEVEFTIHEDQSIPPAPQNDPNVLTPDYWGWYDNESKRISLIFGKYFLLNMCFPSGLKATEEAGRGKAYRLNIIKSETSN